MYSHIPTPPEWVEEYEKYLLHTPDVHEVTAEMRMFEREYDAMRWLAKTIGVKLSEIGSVLYDIRISENVLEEREKLYRPFRILKRSGGYRQIYDPAKHIRIVQDKLNKYFRKEYERHGSANGFSGGGIVEALQPHTSATCILKIDFKNAFPTVRKYDVLREFVRDHSWYVANIIADLTTYHDKLPQGALTSPRVFDIVCEPFDRHMSKLVRNYDAVYTRFADNIFVSVSDSHFPQPLRNGIIRAIDSDRGRRGPSFSWHKLSVQNVHNSTFHALGLNIVNGKLHNTRSWKRRFRKRIAHVRYLLDHNLPHTQAFDQLESMAQFVCEQTLSPTLAEAFDSVYHQVYRVRRPWMYDDYLATN